jgi:hypothetical protein
MIAVRPSAMHCGIRLNSHRNALISLHLSNALEIKLNIDCNVQIIVNVKEKKENNSESTSIDNAHIVQKISPELAVINLCFPRAMTTYNVHIFCKQKEKPDYYHAMTYVVELGIVSINYDGLPLLYQAFFDNDCYIISPMRGRLKRTEPMEFKLKVPRAKEVAVVLDGSWHQLFEIADVFEGSISADHNGSLVCVFANFGDGTFVGLCRYTLM